MSKTTRLKTGGLQVFTVRLVVSLFRLKNSKHPVQKSNLSVLRYADYSLKPPRAYPANTISPTSVTNVNVSLVFMSYAPFG